MRHLNLSYSLGPSKGHKPTAHVRLKIITGLNWGVDLGRLRPGR